LSLIDFHRPMRRTDAAPVLRPWLVWGAGAGVYVLAVFHRSSLGVAGPEAQARLGLTATQLSLFVMLQLGMYAAMQVPTGIMVDRFGPRRMLLAATLVMGSAQLLFAFVHTYPLALLARGLLGVGDAMTYISVLRLAAGWFPARHYPVITALTGLLGTCGNLIATLPLTALLHNVGWTVTFAVAGALSLAYALVLIRKSTVAPFGAAGRTAAAGPVQGRRVRDEVRQAWRMPAGRLGFWVHLTTMTGPVVFATLWGFPYLTQGLGYSTATASGLLMVMVGIGVVANLSIGFVVARRPVVRTPLAIVVIVTCLAAWAVLVGWPGGRPPLAVVVGVIVVLAVGGPASAVAFMLARDYNPRHRISTATGMVNIGGFCGAVVGIFVVGQVLDHVDNGADVHSLAAFRWAFAGLALLTAVALWRLLTWWLRTRAEVLLSAARGEDVPVPIAAHKWELIDEADLIAEAQQAGLTGPDDQLLRYLRPVDDTSSTAGDDHRSA